MCIFKIRRYGLFDCRHKISVVALIVLKSLENILFYFCRLKDQLKFVNNIVCFPAMAMAISVWDVEVFCHQFVVQLLYYDFVFLHKKGRRYGDAISVAKKTHLH